VITKRQLGLIFIALAAAAVAASFLYDFLGGGQFQGIGPAQRLGLLGAVVLALVGLSLLPMGDRPA
jgi:hypothetical protein